MRRMKCIRAAYEHWENIVTHSQYIRCTLRIFSYAARNISVMARGINTTQYYILYNPLRGTPRQDLSSTPFLRRDNVFRLQDNHINHNIYNFPVGITSVLLVPIRLLPEGFLPGLSRNMPYSSEPGFSRAI